MPDGKGSGMRNIPGWNDWGPGRASALAGSGFTASGVSELLGVRARLFRMRPNFALYSPFLTGKAGLVRNTELLAITMLAEFPERAQVCPFGSQYPKGLFNGEIGLQVPGFPHSTLV